MKGHTMAILITYKRTLASGASRTLTVEVPASGTEWDDVRDRAVAHGLSQGRGQIVKALAAHDLVDDAVALIADAVSELDTEWARVAQDTARKAAQAVLGAKGTRTADRARHACAALKGRGKLVR